MVDLHINNLITLGMQDCRFIAKNQHIFFKSFQLTSHKQRLLMVEHGSAINGIFVILQIILLALTNNTETIFSAIFVGHFTAWASWM